MRTAPALAAATAFFAFASFALGAGIAIVSGPVVQDAEKTATTAVVRWQTDVEGTTVVRFGKTTALGQEFRKIVPIEETEITEVVHTMTLAGLDPDTTYFYVAHSSTPDGTASVDSPMLQFRTYASCENDEYDCDAWGPCDPATSTQRRQCTMTFDCSVANTPKPAESQACTPPCTEDTWDCGAWGACSASGSQTRTCTLATDCPTATTPKPAESQACTPSCNADTWTCTAYGACDAESKTQTRTCTLKTDCPTATTPKPAESRACTVATPPPPPPPPEPAPQPTPAPPPSPTCTAADWTCGAWGECVIGPDGGYFHTRNCVSKETCPNNDLAKPALTEPCEPPAPPAPATIAPAEGGLIETLGDAGAASTVTIGSEPGSTDPNSPLDPDYVVTLIGRDDGMLQQLVAECRDNGILAGRCAAWLEAKYQDRRCLDAGKTSQETCEGYLSGLNGGTFPGCEGRTDAECDAVKTRALLGYLPDAAKGKFDAALQGALDAGRPVETIDGLTAVTPESARGSIWWPSLPGEGAAPAMVIGDLDRDGLPDDLEERMGWDPLKPDVEAGSGKLSRDVLKSFFEKGDKPAQFVFVDVDGNGSLDLIEDRKLLGLKNYDPTRVYLPGDTSRRVRNMMSAFFGGDLSLHIGIDQDGDGASDAKVSRDVLKSFFETGDVPTAEQFSSSIDAKKFGLTDLALITGAAIGQPVGAGEVDPTFTVLVDMDIDQPDMAATIVPMDANQPSNFEGGMDANQPTNLTIPASGSATDNANLDANSPLRTGYNEQGNEGDYSKGFVLSGRAAPNTVVVLYVYSYVPMVLTTTTDENGNYTYDVSEGVIDGEHTAYVAITDDTGKVVKKSGPLSFFVKEARAATEDEFESPDVNVPMEPVAVWQRSYLIGAAVAVLAALVGVWLIVARKLGPDQAPPPPAEPPKAS